MGTYLSALLLALCSAALVAAQPRAAAQCHPQGSLVKLPAVTEASGVAVSHGNRNRIWAHNDSGRPVLVELSEGGAVARQVRLSGVTVEDWEATAVGPCPSGSCLYLGDIGDNNANRKRIAIYRLPEPDAASDEVTVRDVFYATYPDGSHDAETLLVMPSGDLFIVTTGKGGPLALYRLPRNAQPGSTIALAKVGSANKGGDADDAKVTDGAVSPNGKWIVLRTHRELLVYSAPELTSGKWREQSRFDVSNLAEPQGEGVAFANDTTLYLVGEGGGKAQGGTFARVSCAF